MFLKEIQPSATHGEIGNYARFSLIKPVEKTKYTKKE